MDYQSVPGKRSLVENSENIFEIVDDDDDIIMTMLWPQYNDDDGLSVCAWQKKDWLRIPKSWNDDDGNNDDDDQSVPAKRSLVENYKNLK